MKWTPGPWTIGPNEPSVKSLGKLQTIEIGGQASATWNCQVLADEYGHANASLISAAPELYAALQLMVDACNKRHFDMEALYQANKAMLKARGE